MDQQPIVSVKGTVVRIDVADRYRYRRGEPARRLAPISRITIATEPTSGRTDEGDDFPEPYEYDVPREFAETLRVGQEVRFEIRVVAK